MPEETDFETLYRQHHAKVLGYVTRLTHGHHEAEDITQEVFEKVDRALRDFQGKSTLSTWIYRIATNTTLDRMKSPSFKRRVEGLPTPIEEGVPDRDVWDGQRKPAPDISAVRKEMNTCIRGYVEKLSPDYKTVIILSELEGFKNREIAEILGVSLETVKVRLHRARARLRQELETACSFYHDERNVLSCDLKTAFGGGEETD